jgi:hypothetical protein
MGETGMSIKCYYFPLGTAKQIRYSEIAEFGTATQFGLNSWGTKTWGMALSPVWWALGSLTRGNHLDEQIVLRLNRQTIECGFTSDNPPAVLRILNDKTDGAFARLVAD